jgi:hypothetical protein
MIRRQQNVFLVPRQCFQISLEKWDPRYFPELQAAEQPGLLVGTLSTKVTLLSKV